MQLCVECHDRQIHLRKKKQRTHSQVWGMLPEVETGAAKKDTRGFKYHYLISGLMSRARITDDIATQMKAYPVELGHALALVGDILKKGIEVPFLDADERKERGNVPFYAAEDIDVRIETCGKVLVIGKDRANRPAVSIPVGQSDKMTTAIQPKDWMNEILIQALISVFDGDDTYAWSVVNAMDGWIESASVETEDGRLKIDQDRLPNAKNAVVIAEMLSKLKRTFRTTSKGTARLNLSLSVEDAPTVARPRAITIAPMDDLIAIPAVENAHASHATTDFATPVAGLTTGDEVMSVAASPPSQENGINDAIMSALGGEGRTIGYIRKALIDYDEANWKPRLEALVKRGQVSKEGRARATRYFGGTVIE